MNWISQNWVYLLLALGVLFLMTRGGAMGHGMHARHGASGHRFDGDRLEQAIDPVSGRAVDPQASVATVYRGQEYRFESRENRDLFEAAPDKYATPIGSHAGAHEHRHHRGGC